MTPANRRRLEHAARMIGEVADESFFTGRDDLANPLALASEMVRQVIAKEHVETIAGRSADLVAVDAPLAVVTLCRFCIGTGIREACDHELKWACRDCNGTGLQSEDYRKAAGKDDERIAGPLAIANNLKAILAAMEPFRVLGSTGPTKPRHDPQVDVIDGETA